MASLEDIRTDMAFFEDITDNIKTYYVWHIESHEYMCLYQDRIDYIAIFLDMDTAIDFIEQSNLQEFTEIQSSTFGELKEKWKTFYFNGELCNTESINTN